jgi:eukaryotic-like serine/threonine-protein kinase
MPRRHRSSRPGRADGVSLLRSDQEIHGTYVVERFLGEGAFAEVYRVRHRFLGRQAMKVFKGAGMTPSEIESVLGEAILLSQLGHPNIVRVFDANTLETAQGTCGFFTMEFVAGGSLERFWASHGARFVPVDTTVQILTQVCRGLSVAHGESPPIVHRDIKPHNVLVGYDANGLRARVSDFGLAKRVNPLSLMASARGTVGFKAPETFLDPQADSCAGDVWALGTLAYLLLTDHLPYGDVTELDLVKGDVFQRPVTLPSRLNIDVDHHLDRIVLRALATAPADRYAHAGEMLAELDDWSAAARPTGKSLAPAVTSKERISPDASSFDESRAAAMVDQAFELARQAATLADAADLMEEAFNKAPGLRDRHAGRVRLWRNGIVQ